MKWLIASDIHGSAPCCERLLLAFRREGADMLLLLGDLLYHGPRNDLPEGYDPKAAARLLNSAKESILCVRGNCDAEVDEAMLDFPITAEYAVISEGNRRIYAAHGHHNEDRPLPMTAGDVLLSGHTHIPLKEERNGRFYLNPGSVSIPKGDSKRSYMICEGGVFTWKTLDGEEFDSLAIN